MLKRAAQPLRAASARLNTLARRRGERRRPTDAAQYARTVRRRWRWQTVLGLVMLPLSALPVYFYLSSTEPGYLTYLRGRYSLLPPETPQLGAEAARVAQEYHGRPAVGVPVLVYHGINRGGSSEEAEGFVVSRDRFAEQMRSLRAAGYTPIASADLARYLESRDEQRLPDMPVLITFDDGRADAMIQADPILADSGMKATMFVIGRQAQGSNFYYESWGSLAKYRESGRWELQNHTYGLHEQVSSGEGTHGALVDRRSGESLGEYRRRVAADLDRNQDLIEEHTGVRPVAFAYPFSDWGETRGARIARTLHAVLLRRFALAFDQDNRGRWRPALPGDDPVHLHRLEVADWTGPQLLRRLGRGERLAEAVYAERALGYRYTAMQLARAAKRTTCSSADYETMRAVRLSGEKLVALTFNGGPSADTPKVLDALRSEGAAATFFTVGEQIGTREGILRRMLMEGDEVANGTFTRPRPEGRTAGELRFELRRTTRAITEAIPVDVCFARPPFGNDTERFAAVARRLGLATALWSVDPRDYSAKSPQQIVRRVLRDVSPGAVVTLQDGGGDRRATVEAVPRIVSALRARGYRLVTLSELVRQALDNGDDARTAIVEPELEPAAPPPRLNRAELP